MKCPDPGTTTLVPWVDRAASASWPAFQPIFDARMTAADAPGLGSFAPEGRTVSGLVPLEWFAVRISLSLALSPSMEAGVAPTVSRRSVDYSAGFECSSISAR